MRRHAPAAIVAAIAIGLAAWTSARAVRRLDEFRTAWPWDLAFNNQWYWAATRGDGTITVRPIASFATEGPSIYKLNHMAAGRFALIPIYAAWPGPSTLLVVQAVAFWGIVPAAYLLARGESGSRGFGLAAAALVPLTPLLGPLAENDFRELQMGMPFVLVAVEGVRARRLGPTAAGVVGMLAWRQEFAILVSTLAVVGARDEREDAESTLRWALSLFFLGLAWTTWAYLGYLHLVVERGAAAAYLGEFDGARPPLLRVAATGADFLRLGLGSWAVLAILAPRVALLALPWLWGLSAGRWAIGYLGTESWHHVRYTAPMVAAGIAAGLCGLARLWSSLPGPRPRAVAWVVVAAGLIAPKSAIDRIWSVAPTPIDAREAAEINGWIARVGPDDGVVCAYEVSAPLSTRRLCYGNRLDVNKPPGYPASLPGSIVWAFLRNDDVPPPVLESQGFERVHRGAFASIYRRAPR